MIIYVRACAFITIFIKSLLLLMNFYYYYYYDVNAVLGLRALGLLMTRFFIVLLNHVIACLLGVSAPFGAMIGSFECHRWFLIGRESLNDGIINWPLDSDTLAAP